MLRTPKQRKELCKDCPVARAADCVGDSATLLIVRDLLRKPRRFGDLERSLKGISTRTLSNKLKELQAQGIIDRKETASMSHALYTLTKKGKGLAPVEQALEVFGKKYLKN